MSIFSNCINKLIISMERINRSVELVFGIEFFKPVFSNKSQMQSFGISEFIVVIVVVFVIV